MGSQQRTHATVAIFNTNVALKTFVRVLQHGSKAELGKVMLKPMRAKAVEQGWSTLKQQATLITGDYWRLLEIAGDCWRLLEITGDY